MPQSNTLESKVAYRIKRRRDSIFMREDFEDLGGYDQVGRVLRGLVKDGLIIKAGYGLYVRAKKSSLSGKTIPEIGLQEIASTALSRLGVKTAPTIGEKEYNQGLTTQVPSGRQVKIVKGRCSRKIGYDGKYIRYETAS
ncbi:MAG: hypothetical protein CMK70_03080 [Pseudohongiella sp.]|nr:hypothetical protein [Pseudohongiella sp.]|tara:strand:+ start:3291 stop:3707 length:417 start_codon:yes stop_codon:yes gene_type:complete